MKDFSYFIRAYKDSTFTQELMYQVINYGDSGDFSFYVKIGQNTDGGEVILDSTAFNLIYDNEVITITQEGNKVNVHVDSNETIEDLSNIISIVPILLDYTETYVYVIQKANVFSISGESGVTLPKFEKKEEVLPIVISGGTERFRIKAIRKLLGANKLTLYDNGLNYKIDNTIGNQNITIMSYGIPFLEEGAYYEIEVCHEQKLVLPENIIDVDENSEFFGTFIEDPDYEAKLAQLSHVFTIRYGGGSAGSNTSFFEGDEENQTTETRVINFSYRGETQYFSISDNTEVEAISVPDNVDWCHIDTNRALNYAVTCDENTSYEERTCQCEIFGENVEIYQNGKPVNLVNYDVIFEHTNAEPQVVNLYHIDSCNAIRNGNWYTVDKTVENGHVKLEISCSDNTNETPREKVVNIKQGNIIIATVTIKQKGFLPEMQSDDTNTSYLKIYIGGETEDCLCAYVKQEIDGTITKEHLQDIVLSKIIQDYDVIIKTRVFDREGNPHYDSLVTATTSGVWLNTKNLVYVEDEENIHLTLSVTMENKSQLARTCYFSLTNKSNRKLTIGINVTQSNMLEID